jgi:hypothetical protein
VPSQDGDVRLDGGKVPLLFLKVAEPKVVKNPLHLDCQRVAERMRQMATSVRPQNTGLEGVTSRSLFSQVLDDALDQ